MANEKVGPMVAASGTFHQDWHDLFFPAAPRMEPQKERWRF